MPLIIPKLCSSQLPLPGNLGVKPGAEATEPGKRVARVQFGGDQGHRMAAPWQSSKPHSCGERIWIFTKSSLWTVFREPCNGSPTDNQTCM